ncbi:MAG: glycine cleavage system transcriptional repressor, partial [Oceanisphaera sp.]|nr:glycine cleavage system transcriptional repressor [Oceanisphaera sp.]
VNRCTQFFSDRGWDIQAMQSQTMSGIESGQFQAHFQLNLPEQLTDGDVEDAVDRLCRELECERHSLRLKRK